MFLFYIVMAYITQTNHPALAYTSLVSDREHMFNNKNVFQLLLDKCQNIQVHDNQDILEMHGVSQEEIENIKTINNSVVKGKEKLQLLLQEYGQCVKDIDALTKKTKDVEDKLHQFEYLHHSLLDVDKRFETVISSSEELTNLKLSVMEELETQLASASIEKDRLEALIMSLSKTYSILRDAPLVHICPICMTNDVDTFLEPCGHTICKECVSNKFNSSSKFCFMCRTAVRGIRRLYYS